MSDAQREIVNILFWTWLIGGAAAFIGLGVGPIVRDLWSRKDNRAAD